MHNVINALINKVVLYKGKHFQIVTYGLMYGLAGLVVAQTFFALWYAQNGPLTPAFLLFISVGVSLGVVLCSKIIFLLYNLNRLWREPLAVLNQTGYAFFGGFFGMLLTVYVGAKWFYPGRLLNLLDFLFVCVPLGQILQRVGCLTFGCCYGHHYSGPLAIRYTNPDAKAYRQVGDAWIHPTQLYSIYKNIGLGLTLLVLFTTLPYPGLAFAMWLILYSMLRFFVDFTRYTQDIFLWGLRFSQFFAVLTFALGLVMLGHVKPEPYVFQYNFVIGLSHSLLYLPYSLLAFVILFISYGYHSKQLGLYVAP